MNNISLMLRQFNWRVLLIRFLVNAATLYIVVIVTPKVSFVDQSLLNVLLLAVALGILNGLIKPVIQFFTLPFIFTTYGFIVVLVNTLILWLLGWIFPDRIVVGGLLWAFFAGALYGIISAFLESLFGLNAPILPDEPEEAELRERVESQTTGVVRTLVETREAEPPQLADISDSRSEDAKEVIAENETTRFNTEDW